MMAATPPFQSSTVDASSQRASKRVNAHQRHTRSVQSSSCAEGGFFSSPICIVHGMRPKSIVPSRCCSILSAIRTATRRSHQIDAYPVSTARCECTSCHNSRFTSTPGHQKGSRQNAKKMEKKLEFEKQFAIDGCNMKVKSNLKRLSLKSQN